MGKRKRPGEFRHEPRRGTDGGPRRLPAERSRRSQPPTASIAPEGEWLGDVQEGEVATAGARAAAAVARRLDDLFTAGGQGFRRLAVAHAASTAGDALVTIALAGTLFFSVPSSEARGNVFGYLLLTVAPFAVIGPLLGRLLDRDAGAARITLVVSSAGRAVLAVVLLANLDALWLFPAAFGLLVLSRTYGIARNTILPTALDRPLKLVAANAKLAQVGVLAGAAVVPFGLLATMLWDATGGLLLATVAFGASTVVSTTVPRPDLPAVDGGAPGRASASGLPRRRRDGGRVVRAPFHWPPPLRLAQLATATVRFLNGFLVLLLAFAFKDADAGALDFGAVLGAAGVGYTIASVISPTLERHLREEPMVVAAMAIEAAAAFFAGQWFGLPAAAALAGAAGLSWGTAKLAFDGMLQGSLPAQLRGAAFTRSETGFALAWVFGAAIPTGIEIPVRVGLVIAGLVALGGQVVYVAQLLIPLRQPDTTADPTPGPGAAPEPDDAEAPTSTASSPLPEAGSSDRYERPTMHITDDPW